MYNWRFDPFTKNYNLVRRVNIFRINNNKYYQLQEIPFYDTTGVKRVRVWIDTGANKTELSETFSDTIGNNQFKVDYIPDPNISLIRDCSGTGRVKINSTITSNANVIIEYYGIGTIDYVYDDTCNYEVSEEWNIADIKAYTTNAPARFNARIGLTNKGVEFVSEPGATHSSTECYVTTAYFNGTECLAFVQYGNTTTGCYLSKYVKNTTGLSLLTMTGAKLPYNFYYARSKVVFTDNNGRAYIFGVTTNNTAAGCYTTNNMITAPSGTSITWQTFTAPFFTAQGTWANVGNLIYYFGGSSTNTGSGSLAYVINPNTFTFTSLTNTPFTIGGSTNRENLIFCGYDGNGKILLFRQEGLGQGAEYDILTGQYTSKSLIYPNLTTSNAYPVSLLAGTVYKRRFMTFLYSYYDTGSGSYTLGVLYVYDLLKQYGFLENLTPFLERPSSSSEPYKTDIGGVAGHCVSYGGVIIPISVYLYYPNGANFYFYSIHLKELFRGLV